MGAEVQLVALVDQQDCRTAQAGAVHGPDHQVEDVAEAVRTGAARHLAGEQGATAATTAKTGHPPPFRNALDCDLPRRVYDEPERSGPLSRRLV